ncbi:RES family NAD+ phosphorylase [Spirosoma litoris]
MEVYRINKEPYHTDPLSTIGSYQHGGRWNPKGVGILYTSRTPELALLETLVHLPPVTLSELPQLWLSTLHLPDLPNAESTQQAGKSTKGNSTIFWITPNKLPAYWKSGTLAETQTILTEWLIEPFCLAVAVPSVIMPESYNLLLHPQHPAFAEIEVISQRPIPLDTRLIK